MATLSINFQANTTGIHHIGYKTYNDVSYTVLNLDVTVPGSQTVVIDVPANLYCAHSDVLYTGYVIAECMDQTDSNSDDIPDLAITWSVTLVSVADPCTKVDIQCSAVKISSVNIVFAGNLCAPDDDYSLVFTSSPGDEIVPAVGTVTVSGGIVVDIVLTDPGLYMNPPTVSDTIPGCTDIPVYSIVMEPSCESIMLSDYACASFVNLSGDSSYTIDYGDTVTICGDSVSLGALSNEFTVSPVSNCHCESCQSVVIDATSSTSGSGNITYQTCWDGSNVAGQILMISQVVNFGQTMNLGCILADTLVVNNDSLDTPVVINTTTC